MSIERLAKLADEFEAEAATCRNTATDTKIDISSRLRLWDHVDVWSRAAARLRKEISDTKDAI